MIDLRRPGHNFIYMHFQSLLEKTADCLNLYPYIYNITEIINNPLFEHLSMYIDQNSSARPFLGLSFVHCSNWRMYNLDAATIIHTSV